MLPVFDAVILVFVFSCSYMLFKAGVYWAFAAGVAGFVIQRLIQLWTAQSGVWSYALFFAGVVIACAVIVILCALYVNVISKYEWLLRVNRLCGLVAGCFLGLMFVSVVMMPVALKAGQPVSKAAASSFTVSHVVPWVQELFPDTQAMIINKINKLLTATPSSVLPPASEKKGPGANPFGAPTLQAVSDQVQ
jgi:hypothetical protein